MKKAFFAFFVLASAAALARPGIEPGSVSLDIGDNCGTVTYTLTGTPAVVTIDLQTNTLANGSGEWASIGGENIGLLGGEANKVVYVTNTPVKAYWFHGEVCPGKSFAAGTLRALVTAYPTNNPPDYMVVNMCGLKNIVRWYASTNTLPGGFANLEYKSTKMLMRKVPAKNVVWTMGSPGKLTDEGNATTNVPAYKVMFTEDYYIGVYEVTQSQYTYMSGGNRCLFRNEPDADYRPAEKIAYNILRGGIGTYTWPLDGHEVLPTGPIGRLRAQCGIADMDLPTEAQWEYACRAGSATDLPCNMEFSLDNLLLFAVKKDNSETAVNTSYIDKYGVVRYPKNRTSIVGSKRPNDWGIYDMLGNVYEYCLDRQGVDDANNSGLLAAFHASLAEGWQEGAVTVNPTGAVHNTNRVMKRGGSFYEGKDESTCRIRAGCALDYDYTDTSGVGYNGFRLCCSVKEAVK